MSRKNPNIKEFVKYLDYTVKIFDKHVAEEDFEKKDSDVYKLFDTLLHMYDNISKENNPQINFDHLHFGADVMLRSSNRIRAPDIDFCDCNEFNSDESHQSRGIDMNNINNPKWENNHPVSRIAKKMMDTHQRNIQNLTSVSDSLLTTENNSQYTLNDDSSINTTSELKKPKKYEQLDTETDEYIEQIKKINNDFDPFRVRPKDNPNQPRAHTHINKKENHNAKKTNVKEEYIYDIYDSSSDAEEVINKLSIDTESSIHGITINMEKNHFSSEHNIEINNKINAIKKTLEKNNQKKLKKK